jgi:uncharacterized Zn finger protein (UPF0148 family)
MTTFTDVITETFHVVACASCGVRFGIEGGLYRRAVTKAEGSVFCPACGKESCWRESADQKRIKELEQKLKWETDHAQRQIDLKEKAQANLSAAKASLSATKAVVTRMKGRVAAGVCPCCNRTFKQLASHMKHKHPQFVCEKIEPVP